MFALGSVLMCATTALVAVLFMKNSKVSTDGKSDRHRDECSSLIDASLNNRPDFRGYFLEHGRMTFRHIILDSPTGNTPHTEIDRIILTPYGLYCIEDKDCQGIIFGDKKTKNWTQCTYRSRVPLYNPIRQNYKHECALRNLLGDDFGLGIRPYVVFTKKAYLLKVDERNVLHGEALLEEIIDSHTQPVYSLNELNEIAQKLRIAEIVSPYLRPSHIQEVKRHLAASAAG